jgi:hypothetical protein
MPGGRLNTSEVVASGAQLTDETGIGSMQCKVMFLP